MNFIRTSGLTAAASWLVALLLCSNAANADSARPSVSSAVRQLPELPGSAPAGAHLGFDGQQVELGYGGRQQVWDARLDEFVDLKPSVTLDYGTRLTERLAAGAALHRENSYADVWINGVYAPARNLRLHLAGGQLRAASDSDTSGNPGLILQNSYLLDARHYWNDGPVSDFGVGTYEVEANAAGSRSSTANGTDVFALGRQQGNMLNLSLRPLSGSRIELWRETRRLTYDFGDGSQDRQYLVSNRIRFSQRLDDCLHLQGGYSTNEEAHQLDLKLARKKWFVSLSHSQDGSDNDISVGIGYTLPMGRSPDGGRKCTPLPADTLRFGPIIDATVKRPDQFPLTPLTADSAID